MKSTPSKWFRLLDSDPTLDCVTYQYDSALLVWYRREAYRQFVRALLG